MTAADPAWWPKPTTRGRHRRTLKRRWDRWNERYREENERRAMDRADRRFAKRYLRRLIDSAQPKRQAGKSARTAMMLIPIGALTATLHNPLTWPVYIATCSLWFPAAVIGVRF